MAKFTSFEEKADLLPTEQQVQCMSNLVKSMDLESGRTSAPASCSKPWLVQACLRRQRGLAEIQGCVQCGEPCHLLYVQYCAMTRRDCAVWQYFTLPSVPASSESQWLETYQLATIHLSSTITACADADKKELLASDTTRNPTIHRFYNHAACQASGREYPLPEPQEDVLVRETFLPNGRIVARTEALLQSLPEVLPVVVRVSRTPSLPNTLHCVSDARPEQKS